jgi:hypothetical protein
MRAQPNGVEFDPLLQAQNEVLALNPGDARLDATKVWHLVAGR